MIFVRNTGKIIFCYLSLSYLGPEIREILRVEIKQTESLLEFKAKTKNWNPQGCLCRLCKVYLHHAEFI